MPKDWMFALEGILDDTYLDALFERVHMTYENELIFPPQTEIFQALSLCPLSEVKVVILGQDPYHGEGQAHGLAFSVRDGVAVPPSLRNIYRELKDDLKIDESKSGNLSHWAKQGVLLLNSSLTVRSGEAASHRPLGWEKFTDNIISIVNNQTKNTVFILWGSHAQAKRTLIDESKHLVITAPHPSPLSAYRGFFGSKPFSHTNNYLKLHGKRVIKW